MIQDLDHAKSYETSKKPDSSTVQDLSHLAACDSAVKEEPEFEETHCHWKDCDREFLTQDQLVKVSLATLTWCLN